MSIREVGKQSKTQFGPLTLMLPGTPVAMAIGQVSAGAGVVLTFICSYMMQAFITNLSV